MAVLSKEQAQKYYEKPLNTSLVEARKDYIRLNVHVNGVGVAQYIDHMVQFENKAQFDLRVRLTKSNKNIYARLLRPKDKIYTAKGGGSVYDLPESQQDTFKKDLSNVRNGISLKDWLHEFHMPKVDTDPNGLIFMEVNGNPYPTYKSITSIRDYVTKGLELEYVIFEPVSVIHNNEEVQMVRVVDEEFDYTYIIKESKNAQGKVISIEFIEIKKDTDTIKGTKKNEFGKVPARIISERNHPLLPIKIAMIDDSIELADEYLIDKSIHTIYKKLHGFPLFWRIIEDCPACEGTGRVSKSNGKGTLQCQSCKGLKKRLTKDVSDMIGISPPLEGEPAITANSIGGYITPPSEQQSEMREELNWLFVGMEFATWGSNTREDAENETATGVFIHTQPVNDKLNVYSKYAENIDSWCSDMIGKVLFPQYKGSSIHYGRRYILETPDTIWNKYEKAREKGAPIAALNHHLNEFYQSEFEGSDSEFKWITTISRIEPSLHSNVSDIEGMQISSEYKEKKLLYSDWVATLTESDKIKSYETLLNDFTIYLTENKLKKEENGEKV